MGKTERFGTPVDQFDFPALLSGIIRSAQEMGLAVYNAEHLKAGHIRRGPCIVKQHSATIVVPPGGFLEITKKGDFMITLDD